MARSGGFSLPKASASKKACAPPSRTGPTSPEATCRWKRHQARFDPRRLVFIDETWAKTNMTRTHGRCRPGERLAKVPHGHWKTLTFLAALRSRPHHRALRHRRPDQRQSFLAYVEQILVPTLKPGDIVVMDNLGSHKRQGRTPRHPRRRRQALLPAALSARPQSHRAGLRQAQSPAAQSRRANRRSHLAAHRPTPRPLHPSRMRQLPHQRRICFNQTE